METLTKRELLIIAIIAYNNLDAESIKELNPQASFKIELEKLRNKLGELLDV